MIRTLTTATFILLSAASFVVFGQTDDFVSAETARADARQVDIVAYVNVREAKVVGTLGGDPADCGLNRRAGYCRYMLTADVLEVFKGKQKSRKVEFFTTIDSDFPSSRLIGERVVFLNRLKNSSNGKTELGALENSTRPATPEILNGLRRKKPRRSNSKN